MKKISAVLVYNYFQPFKDPVSILAALIRIFTFTRWNHVELLIEEEGEKFLIGAVYPKIRKIDFDTWSKFRRQYKIMEINSYRTHEEMIDTARHMVGIRYDRDSLLLFMPFYLINRVWLGRENEKAKKGLYCFELLGYVAGWREYWKITPNEALEGLTEPSIDLTAIV